MMAKKVKVLSPLLSELFPRLAEQGFGESDVDSVGGILVARVQATYVERLMIDVESIPDRQGEWSFRVMCGVEFHDLERNGWVGIPETHSPSLVMKCFSCRPSTDWGELSEELSEWIAAAFMTIANDSESIRQAYFRLIENSDREHMPAIVIVVLEI